MADPTVGLTGATGVLGRRIVEHLTRNGCAVAPYEGDIRDRDTVERFVERVDLIIHAAAIVPVKRVEAHLADAIAVNAGASAQLAAVASRANRPLTFISTSHVYAATEGPLSESSPVEPSSLYGLTKLQGEQWVRALCDDHLILRLFSYFDARQAAEYLVPSLRSRIMDAARGATITLGGAESIRDIASADWLAERCTRLVLGGARGTINLCTGQPSTVIEIARALGHEMKRDDIVWRAVEKDRVNSLLGDPSLSDSLIGKAPRFGLEAALAQAFA